MRFFNTEGPVRPDDHYAISPLDRMDVDELLGLIRAKRYFVLHAPRQTGKTSALIALRDLLNSGAAGNFRCLDVNVEVGQVARDDVARGIRAVLSNLAESALLLGDDYPDGVWPDVLAKAGPENALKTLLARWCVANPTPLVLLVDEIDSLVGDTLLSRTSSAPAPATSNAPGPSRRASYCAGCGTSATTGSGRAPGRSSPAAARSTSPRSLFAWATSPKRRPAP